MGVLTFEKPKKLRSSEEHNSKYSSDSGINGTYVPNMSKEDMYKWKAKHIKGSDERIEIRKTISGTQLLVIVKREGGFTDRNRYLNTTVKMSMNGPLFMSNEDVSNLNLAINEAKEILNK
jgi:hypothetical protein